MSSVIRLSYRIIRANLDINTLSIMLMMPVGYLLVMGLMMRTIVPPFHYGSVTINYITFIAPGIIADQILIGGALAGWVLWVDRRMGMLEQIFSLPYTRFQYLLSTLLAMILITFMGASIMTLIAIPFISIRITVLGFVLVLIFLVLGTFTFGAIMLALGATIKSNQLFNMISNVLFFIFTFASSIFYPITAKTPIVLLIFAQLNPLTYVVDGIRDAFLNMISITTVFYILVLTITSIGAMAIGTYAYIKMKFVATA